MDFFQEKDLRENFRRLYETNIIDWVDKNRSSLISYRTFRWLGSSYESSRKKRDDLESEISKSIQRNHGGLDPNTINRIFLWGFGKLSPFTNYDKTISVTREALEHLGAGNCYEACKILMRINGIGVAGSTKILGLSNQKRYCIYDSRVGLALQDLRTEGKKLILCPPGRTISGDYVPQNLWDHTWSWNYQKLIWTLQIALEHLRIEDGELRISDLEMSLFMKGGQIRSQMESRTEQVLSKMVIS